MELRQLRVFRAVARRMSFTRAAEELGYAQSSVTAQVKSLERELGVSLFDRLGRGISLTDAGCCGTRRVCWSWRSAPGRR